MNGWIALAMAAGIVVLLVVGQKLGLVDLSSKNRSSGTHGGVMGIGDEVFNPRRYEAQLELDRQTMLPAPAPLAGDGDKGIYSGTVRIDIETDPGALPDGALPEGRLSDGRPLEARTLGD